MASDQPIPETIRQEAARWVAERDAGLLTAKDQGALADWLAADPRHTAAFARLEHTWDLMGGASAKAEIRRRSTVLPFRSAARPQPWLGAAIAASLVLAVVGIVQDWPTRVQADAMTMVGEQRTVRLDDGSTVRLNTGSAIRIDYRGDRRVVELLKGEASFTVAADRSRPFTVEAGGGATTALGTRFIIRREGADTNILVTEHRVRVAWPFDESGVGVDLAEGQATRYGPGGLAAPRTVDTEMAGAWMRGRLVFVDRPLQQVVAELNRYHPGYIHIMGDDLARRRFSGVFPVNDPMGALDTIQQSLGIGSTRVTDRLIFLHE